jgi:hypothetical protein
LKSLVAIGALVVVACMVVVSPLGSGAALAARASTLPSAAGVPPAAGAGPVATPSAGDRATLLSLLSDSVASLSTQSGPSDPRYFSGGVWVSGQDDCFRCNVGPGVAAAALAARAGDKTALDLAIQTFDHAIAAHRQPDGSFGPPWQMETGPDIQTMMFANELGTALIVLTPQLDPGRIRTWTSALTGAADFLVRNNNLSWYTNGNIVLGNALTMALAYRVTGDATYQADYEKALAFAISPDQVRWAGFGLAYSVTPTLSDGSDGAGYLTESGGSGPGYDAEYTSLQADVATRLFWVNGDPRALRLMNLFMNQLLPRINTTTWTLDTSGGTRHPDINRVVGFNSPVLAALAWQGGRADLAPLVSSQIAVIDHNFRGALTYTNIGMYFNLGSEPTSLLLLATASNQDRARTLSLLSDSVDSLSTQSDPSDPRYFSRGIWVSGQDSCFRCNIGPGVAAAAVAASTGDRLAYGLAVLTFDHAIAAHRSADGSFGPPARGETGPDIQTMMFANELGTALIALTPQLDPGRIQTWTSALTGAADFLVRNNNLSWYTNGNIVLGNALTMALAYRATGSPVYQAAYEQALAFAVAPDQPRWAGYGLVYTKTPSRADGSDGAGYLTEAGAGTPGYDPELTAVQADVATRLFWVNGDQRVLRLMNLLVNQIRPRIDTKAWTLDTSGGTRHPQPGRVVAFDSPVLAVLAWQGGRGDLAPLVSSQIAMIDHNFRAALTYSSPAMYFNLGSEPASLLLAP